MNASRRPHHICGATLIEVLVSILLMSFSLLGIAGLMGATIRYQLGIESRSVVTLLFNDLSSRLRTNLAQLANFDASAYLYSATWASQQAAIAAPTSDCGPTATTTCTGTARAAYDLWESRSTTRRALPQGSLQLSGDTTSGFTVTYLWLDKDYTNPAIVSTANPSGLRTSASCTTSDTQTQRQACCPIAADVASTPGVRCLNFTFIP